jgi:uncharacterized protein
VSPTPRPRTAVRRLPEKQRQDRVVLDAILDDGVVAHVAIVDDGQPYALPMAYARDGDRLLLHGSTASRLARALADGVPVCVTVTHLDGLVLARSAFESSMHYRSAMVLGRCRLVRDPRAALERLTEALLPGRWSEVREVRDRELAATSVLELPIEEWSVKVSDGDPEDPAEDQALDIWAGVVPIEQRYGAPRPAADLRPGIPAPGSLERLVTRGRRGASSGWRA